MWETFYRVFKQLPVRIETWAGVNWSGSVNSLCPRRRSEQLQADTHGCQRSSMMMTTSVSTPSVPDR